MGNEQGRQLNDDELKGRQIQQMDWEMKRKLARGVDFNMRVVIRGDRSTGKSCLFNRLQGKPFIEEYNQTPAIQISSIHWNYKVTDDIIKVEVWDVVDVAKKKKPDKGSLKTNNDEEAPPKAPELEIKPPSGKVGEGSHTFGELDARTIDVYKGTHAVVFLFDPSKKWTWEYIEKEAPNVPENIPICLLANFKDSLETIVVTEKVVRGWLQSRKQTVVYLEASMKNCYGLIGVKTFLNLPFLKMQVKNYKFFRDF
jgi:GTPase SAR1 family protein